MLNVAAAGRRRARAHVSRETSMCRVRSRYAASPHLDRAEKSPSDQQGRSVDASAEYTCGLLNDALSEHKYLDIAQVPLLHDFPRLLQLVGYAFTLEEQQFSAVPD